MSKVFLAFSLLIAGCTTNHHDEKNMATASAMFEAFNQHDWEKMASYYSNEANFLDPSYGTEFVTKSRKETVSKYTELEHMVPDVRDEIFAMYPSNQKVIVEFISTGSVSDSVNFKLPIISVLTFQDELIIQDTTYYDLENP
jgi:hypothetical protein